MLKPKLTPLPQAVQKGDLAALKKALAAADPEARLQLNSGLVQAVFDNKTDLIAPLLAAGADPNQSTSIGTLLMCASMNGNLRVVKALLEAGTHINRVFEGETALSALV